MLISKTITVLLNFFFFFNSKDIRKKEKDALNLFHVIVPDTNSLKCVMYK